MRMPASLFRAPISVAVVTLVPIVVALIAFGAFADQYYVDIGFQMLLFAFLAQAWNLVGGFTGQLSLGHAMFVGVGAYTAILLFTRLQISPWVGLGIAGLLGGLLAFIIGLLFFRYKLRGSFFALGTLAVSQILLYIVINTPALGGSSGITSVFTSEFADLQFTERRSYYFAALVFFVVGILLTVLLRYSGIGLRWLAIREDEDAADAAGVNLIGAKMSALVISAALTSMGGVLFAQYLLHISPQHVFGVALSVQIILYAIFGGSGTVWGPTAGVLILYPLYEYLRIELSDIGGGVDLIASGAVLMIALRFFPQGALLYVASLGSRALKPIALADGRVRPRRRRRSG